VPVEQVADQAPHHLRTERLEVLFVLQAQDRRQRKPVIVVRVDPLGQANDPHLVLVHELLERRGVDDALAGEPTQIEHVQRVKQPRLGRGEHPVEAVTTQLRA
jgi:hypothetical protein